jgi:hypothetical protein
MKKFSKKFLPHGISMRRVSLILCHPERSAAESKDPFPGVAGGKKTNHFL